MDINVLICYINGRVGIESNCIGCIVLKWCVDVVGDIFDFIVWCIVWVD